MNHVKCRKFLAMALALSLLTVPVPMTANAVEPETTTEPKETVEEFVLPDMIDPAEAKQNGYIGRACDEEPNLSTLVFKNEDGTNTLRAFSYPVKYVDESGKTKDISLKVKDNGEGGFKTAENNVITDFSGELSEGISLDYEEISIRLMPDAENQTIAPSVSEDNRTVEYRLDDKTALSYALTCTGFKEDIVVSEYTGQTDYGFTLYTDGLELWEQDGSYFLRDETGEVRANIGDVIVFTADEKNNTMGSMSAETVSENEEYRLTIHVDDEYLASPETVYPIRIDPTIEINKPSDGMQDTTIYSNNDNPFGNSGALQVGKRADYGVARTLVRFSSGSFNYIHSSLNVNSAYFELYNTNYSDTNAVVVDCYMYEGDPWSQSTITWSTANPDYISSCITSKTVSQVEGYHQTPISNRYSFDVSKAVKRWVDARCDDSYYRTTLSPAFNSSSFQISKGLMFKARDSVENGTHAIYKTFASSNSSTNKPSLTVNYSNIITRNELFSKFNPDRYNKTFGEVVGSNTYSSQYRMNCYAYSIGLIYDGISTVHLNDDGFLEGELQQPGLFSDEMVPINTSMTYVINNINNDFDELGYNVSVYTPNSSVVGQYGTNSRLIAVVYCDDDFHFYMQHNDGTWSHKSGSQEVKNVSISSSYSTNDGKILTNENIQDEAISSNDGELRFLLITKPPQLFNHTKYNAFINLSEITQNSDGGYNIDSGEFFENSQKISPISNRFTKYETIDSPTDVDVFYFDSFLSQSYTVKIDALGVNRDVDCALYNGNGALIGNYNSTGNVYFTYSFSGGNQYYLVVSNHNSNVNDIFEYKIDIY